MKRYIGLGFVLGISTYYVYDIDLATRMLIKYDTYSLMKKDKLIVDAVIADRLPQSALMNKTLSGADFNQIYKNTKFIKLIDVCDRSYYAGLNKYAKMFSPGPRGDGITFIKYLDVDTVDVANKRAYHVSIPDNARVYVNDIDFKCDQIILGNTFSIKETDTTITSRSIRPWCHIEE